jgi:hypothetical protein
MKRLSSTEINRIFLKVNDDEKLIQARMVSGFVTVVYNNMYNI